MSGKFPNSDITQYLEIVRFSWQNNLRIFWKFWDYTHIVIYIIYVHAYTVSQKSYPCFFSLYHQLHIFHTPLLGWYPNYNKIYLKIWKVSPMISPRISRRINRILRLFSALFRKPYPIETCQRVPQELAYEHCDNFALLESIIPESNRLERRNTFAHAITVTYNVPILCFIGVFMSR